MKKFLFILILTFSFVKSFAQLDTEHWFAPMVNAVSFDENIPQRALYFSTNETTPFKVKIYNNNVEIGEVTISKGNPIRFNLLAKYIFVEDPFDLYTDARLGVYTKGDKPYYANLRFSISGALGFVSSKGRAALGTQFNAVVAPIDSRVSDNNFMTSVMATEDDTNVTISGYNSSVIFTEPQGSSIKFKLNKGRSYILQGSGVEADNYDGFIGAKIVSDKPVTIMSGNFLGSFPAGGDDILMDQGVPTQSLGDEFALVKGDGEEGDFTEGAIVVATKDNTAIYVNNAASPFATLNAGEHVIIYDNSYVLSGGSVYNMYIKATNPIYVYQNYAGSDRRNPLDAGELNYVPPLNCFLPKEIGEIGKINENPGVGETGRYQTLKYVKLNIITQTGSTVTINGVPPAPSTGPFPVLGTPDWIIYSIRDIKGNITVNSSTAVISSIMGGDGVSGYGAYFAGVSTVPVITKKSGICVPGIVLECTPGLDSYQWLRNGVPIPGATGTTFTPLESGNYSITVTRGSCSLTLAGYKVLNCTQISTVSLEACQLLTIIPKFTVSTQTVDPKSVIITKIPERGTVAVDNTTGVITFTPYPLVYGIDTFKYKFCGTDEFEDCEEVTVTYDIEKLAVKSDTLLTCKINGIGIFDLSKADIKENLTVSRTYYSTLEGAQNLDPAFEISNFTAYPSAGADVYVVGKTPDGCSEIATITLDFLTGIDITLYNGANCDDNFNGLIEIKLSDITKALLPNSNGLTVRYYDRRDFADAGGPNNLPDNYSYTTPQTIFIRVDTPNCTGIVEPIELKIGTTLPLIKDIATVSDCNFDIENNTTVDLSKYLAEFSVDADLLLSYYKTETDAQNQTNALTNPVAVNSSDNYYYRISKVGFCPVIAKLTLKLPVSSATLQNKTICPEVQTILDAGPGFQSYLWSTGEKTKSISVGVGEYFVDLTSSNLCTYRQKVSVTAFVLPTITSVRILGTSITVITEGGTEPYQYSLNNGSYQSSNVFSNVPSGTNTVSVISADNCTPVVKEFELRNIPNVITPNGDSLNDTFDFSDLKTKQNPKFLIYDRYGRIVFTGDESNNFIWNGESDRRKLISTSYWYLLEWQEPGEPSVIQYSGWVLLKNTNF